MESTLSAIEHILTPFPCCMNSTAIHVHLAICQRSLGEGESGRCHPYTHFFLQADEGTQLSGTKSRPLWVRKGGAAWEVVSHRNCLKTQAVNFVDLGFIPIWVLGNHEEKLNFSESWVSVNGDNHTCLLMAVETQWTVYVEPLH